MLEHRKEHVGTEMLESGVSLTAFSLLRHGLFDRCLQSQMLVGILVAVVLPISWMHTRNCTLLHVHHWLGYAFKFALGSI